MDRKLPLLTPETAPFWTGGAGGALMICRCQVCARYLHPPSPVCLHCGGLDLAPAPVSGRGQIVSFTINHQAWRPDLEVPYIVAIVELVEQSGLRFVSNVVNCPVGEVYIGMPVRVLFERHEDVWLPLFEREL